MFFQKKIVANNFSRCFFEIQPSKLTISNFFRLLQQSVQTIIVNDVLPKISWLKGSKRFKMAKKVNYYFFPKHLFIHHFSMFSDILRCFFRFQPSLTTIFVFLFQKQPSERLFLDYFRWLQQSLQTIIVNEPSPRSKLHAQIQILDWIPIAYYTFNQNTSIAFNSYSNFLRFLILAPFPKKFTFWLET